MADDTEHDVEYYAEKIRAFLESERRNRIYLLDSGGRIIGTGDDW